MLTLDSDDDVGLQVSEGFVWLDRIRIVDNPDGGVRAIDGAEVTLRNCFVRTPYEAAYLDAIGVEVAEASATILYSTVVTSSTRSTPALSCTFGGDFEIRNSLIIVSYLDGTEPMSCSRASVTNSVIDTVAYTDVYEWFVDFNMGDLSLTRAGAMNFADIARWQTGDPTTDIHGDPRPVVNDSPDHAGADVP